MEELILLRKVEFKKRDLYQQDKMVDLIGIDFGILDLCGYVLGKNKRIGYNESILE